MKPFKIVLVHVIVIACAVAAAGCATFDPLATVPDLAVKNDLRRYDETWFAAARLGRADILGALVDARFPVDATTPEGYTALILTAYNNRPAALDYLLRVGANPCVGDRYGNTALMGALFKGETQIAKRLVDASCPIDQVNNAGQTALSFAALFGRLELLPVLVAHGANPDHIDALGRTVLQNAILQGNDSAVALLERVGATPNVDQTLRMRP
ncbi:ankyrin repeat domain-containing protein [Burkholderia sp. Ac-20345]|uniref:ankyrin repeat domain-containing protein n=1 Tax=Burkholderia sp. Ac-20345 TaxID=2703891 RepID=UPI00197CA52E|nr:ankyrin repeat domain-containing protein [Burkholderia sp. Ac-20345]MBN3782149.1 ankyrin repeat domain-containing protein [Burkholderia sp. Ac-20345]